jgi:hypothetical protein
LRGETAVQSKRWDFLMKDWHEQGEMDGDRRLIRVDGLPDQAGIAAALRRAFAAGRQDDCDRDFADLLERLN